MTCFESEDKTVQLVNNGGLFWLYLNKKGNTFDKPFLRAINVALDKVEAHQGPTALVTVSRQKPFSGGMDLNFIAGLEGQDRMAFILELIRTFGRLLALPVPTVAVVEGSAWAGGFMFAMAHDFRVGSTASRYCLNEIQISMYLPPGMMAVVKDKIGCPRLAKEIAL
jgi:enoyl-CoA hydratase/carnithine racemase